MLTSVQRDSPTVMRTLRARILWAHLHAHVMRALLEMARPALVRVIGLLTCLYEVILFPYFF